MKYVAFLDILGFKEKLKSLNQNKARDYISNFSTTIYNIWKDNETNLIKGFIVSDSLIIYSDNTSAKALQEIISVIDAVCKEEFKNNSILIRGAIAKGEFDKLEAKELSSLGKGLVVGQAYVDAYLLEGTIKTLGIALSEEVYEDYSNSNLSKKNILKDSINGKKCNIYRYLDADFLLNPDNLSNFIQLANDSNWLPHYYNALYFAIKKENSDKKVLQIFNNIIKEINGDKISENWRSLDTFIKHTFVQDVSGDFQKRFLKFLREKIS